MVTEDIVLDYIDQCNERFAKFEVKPHIENSVDYEKLKLEWEKDRRYMEIMGTNFTGQRAGYGSQIMFL